MRNDFFDQTENSMPRIGDYAPAFRSVTTQGTIYFPADYYGKWVILFSFPFDSTPESVSELVILNTMHNDLKALNCELVGLPVDLQTRFTTGLHPLKEKIKFPLIENNITEVARKYGIIQPSERNSKAVRSVFFIDPECMIRGVINYPMSLGLNFDELKRVIVGLQTEDEAIAPQGQSFGKAIGLLTIKKVAKKNNEWSFCTRELSEEKVTNVN